MSEKSWPYNLLDKAAMREEELEDRLLALEADVKRLDDLLKAGGICDLSFHIGQVQAIQEHMLALEAENTALRDTVEAVNSAASRTALELRQRVTDLEAALREEYDLWKKHLERYVSANEPGFRLAHERYSKLHSLLHPETAAAPEERG